MTAKEFDHVHQLKYVWSTGIKPKGEFLNKFFYLRIRFAKNDKKYRRP